MLHSHLSFAHAIWRTIITPGDLVIDATLGNGHDALFLAQTLQGSGTLVGYDIQKEALLQTKERLKAIEGVTIKLHLQCHSFLSEEKAKLIVYNLGYLPGSDKKITTLLSTTLLSIQKAQTLLADGGMISITLYPGHTEGLQEYEALLTYAQSLDKKEWLVNSISWPNRRTAPSLLFFQKKKTPLPS